MGGEQREITSLEDAQTSAEVGFYFSRKLNGLNELDPSVLSKKEIAALKADLYMSVSDKSLQISEPYRKNVSTPYIRRLYEMKFQAFQWKIDAEIVGTEQELAIFLNQLAENEDAKSLVAEFKLRNFFKSIVTTETTPEKIDEFKTELMSAINLAVPISTIASLGFAVAQHIGIPAEYICKELVEYIRSPECTLSAEEQEKAVVILETACRLAFGSDPKLYGRTSEGNDFNWESLRGKYVLISFTAPWNDYDMETLSDMLKIYEKYRNKGLEIVSVYVVTTATGVVCMRLQDAVDEFNKSVEKNKLPWIIISEALTVEAGKPAGQGRFYIAGHYPMVLVDKEGKIILAPVGGKPLRDKLTEIFEYCTIER
jgi:thiol-disulfide isomerase/thioredoxin